MIDDTSPLRYIYETYFPDELTKEWKRLTIDQLTHHYKIFTKNDTGFILMDYNHTNPYYVIQNKRNMNSIMFSRYIKYKKSCKDEIIQRDKTIYNG
jgi:hypothetical protein